jgi:WD40 repeat protein
MDVAAWTSDGRWLATESTERGTVSVYETTTWSIVQSFSAAKKYIYSLEFGHDNERLAVATRDGLVTIWNWQQAERILAIEAHAGGARSLAWQPHADDLATGGYDKQAVIWNSHTGRKVHAWKTESVVNSVGWSPDGAFLAIAEANQKVSVCCPSSRELRVFDRHPGLDLWGAAGQYAVAWSPDGTLLAAGSSEGAVVIWDYSSGNEVLRAQGHSSLVRCVAWSPDGHRLATGSNDHTVKIWDLETSEDILTLRGHRTDVFSIAWAADGRLASVGYDVMQVREAPGYKVSGLGEK